MAELVVLVLLLLLLSVEELALDEGEEPVVEVLELLLELELGDEAVLLVLFVVLELLLLFSLPVPLGLTTVVLFSVFFSAAGGLAVSVFCSHAVKSAAPARMQMYFFISVLDAVAHCWVTG